MSFLWHFGSMQTEKQKDVFSDMKAMKLGELMMCIDYCYERT